MGSLNRDTVIAIVLLLICAGVFWQTFLIARFEFASMGSEVWPRLVVGVLAVLSAIYLIQSLRRPAEPLGVGGLGGLWRQYKNPIWAYLVFFAFLLLLDVLGMLLAGILFVFVMLTVLGGRGGARTHLVHAAVAVGSVVPMWAIFTYALNVFLPQGQILRVW